MSALIVLVTLPLIPVFGILVGLATRDRAQAAVARAGVALGALPRRDARPADAGGVPPGRGPVGHDPRDHRPLPAAHPADAADRVRLLGRARAGGDAVGRAGRGHRRHPARARRPGPRDRAGRAAARPRGLLAAAPRRRGVPRRRRGRRDLRGRERPGRRRRRDPAPAARVDAARPRRRCCGPAAPYPLSTTSASPSPTAASRRSPGRRAAASRPCSPCWPGCSSRRPARSHGPDPGRGSRGCRSDRSSCPGTVADNLRLAVPDASDERLWEVLRRVALEERVRDLPAGLDTPLGEDGTTLSAGERARLALARVVLADRPWVLLDEPTAHLDAVTERVIADTVQELGRRRAVVVVAHRPALVALADRVVALTAPAPVVPPGRARGRGPAADRPRRRRRTSPSTERRRGLAAADRPRRPRVRVGGRAHGHRRLADRAGVVPARDPDPARRDRRGAGLRHRPPGAALRRAAALPRRRAADARPTGGWRCTTPSCRSRPARSADAGATCSPPSSTTSTACWTASCGCGCRCAASSITAALALVVSRPCVAPAAVPVVLAVCLAGGARLRSWPGPGRRRAERDAVDARARLSDAVVEATQTAGELAMWQAEDARRRRGRRRVSDELGRRTVAAATWLATGAALVLRRRRGGRGGRCAARARGRRRDDLAARCWRCWCCCPLALGEVGLVARRRRRARGADPGRRGPARRARRPGAGGRGPGGPACRSTATRSCVDRVTAGVGRPGGAARPRPGARARRPGRASSVPPAAARARSRRCCCASSTRSRGAVRLGGRVAARARPRRRTPHRRPGRRRPARLRHDPGRERPPGAARPPPTPRSRPRCGRPGSAPGSTRCPTGSTAGSATATPRCPAASAPGSRSPARCSPTSRCWCSTSPPPTSTAPPPRSSRPRSSTATAAARSSGSPTPTGGLDRVDRVVELAAVVETPRLVASRPCGQPLPR